MAQQEDVFKKVVSHCKEYGFVFPSSEIYDGLGAVYDYGQTYKVCPIEYSSYGQQPWELYQAGIHAGIAIGYTEV